MRALLVAMKKAHPGQDDALKTCWQTLLKMCGNVYNKPGEKGRGGVGWGLRRSRSPGRGCLGRPVPGCRAGTEQEDSGQQVNAMCAGRLRVACRNLPLPHPLPSRRGQVPAGAADQSSHPAARGGLDGSGRLPAGGREGLLLVLPFK